MAFVIARVKATKKKENSEEVKFVKGRTGGTEKSFGNGCSN